MEAASHIPYQAPASVPERVRLRQALDRLTREAALTPPLSLNELTERADAFLCAEGLGEELRGWVMVEIHNSVWRSFVAGIPAAKRLLLLPQCLRDSKRCEAEIDELGLLCHQCGRCAITGLQDRADELGSMSIVAEGFTAVIGLIESGAVDAVIGVSCLDSLEKAFPLLIKNAVPGLAVPLNRAGCRDTEVDTFYVDQLLSLRSDTETRLLDYRYLKSEIERWFSPESIRALHTNPSDQTMAIALDWLAADGKRWRPYLLAATYLAVSGADRFDERTRLAALAVECFHKASLVHDDIQDNDTLRYGKATLNASYGTPIAINIGDALLGKGYQLLAQAGNVELLQAIADSHVVLCEGQGMELGWDWGRDGLTMDFVLEIYRKKTVPAFEVSLLMGVICAGGDPQLRTHCHAYSNALGIAYQLQDDLEDYAEPTRPLVMRPSAVLAIVCQRLGADEAFRQALRTTADLNALLHQPAYEPTLNWAIQEVRTLIKQYHREAQEVLRRIDQVELRRLLFRVTERIIK